MPDLPLPLEAFRDYLGVLARARVGRLARGRADASDVVQQALLAAHRQAGRFAGTSPAQMAAWLRQVLAGSLANVLRDQTRQRRDVRQERSLDAEVEGASARLEAWLAAELTTPSQRAEREERLLALAAALAGLPDDQREAVEMRYLQGLTLNEIAGRLGRTTGSAAGLVHRGLAALRQRLGGEGSR